MGRRRFGLRWVFVALLLGLLLATRSTALTPDGEALFEVKSGFNLSRHSGLLRSWKRVDKTPCAWGGVSCSRKSRVVTIDLSSQGLRGVISPSVGKLKSLESLILSNNSLSGSIPPELGNCTRLLTLQLDNNALSGHIPVELGNLKSLQDITLTTNSLDGEIPAAVAALPGLVTFDVGQNRLTGGVPPMLFQNVKLQWFYVNDNHLTGDITAGLEDLSKLPGISDIWMQNNFFSGTLPASLGNATTIVTLLLNNQSEGSFSLGGTIPKELGKLLNLNTLDLRDNNFTGSIPAELGNLRLLEKLYLSTNHLTGVIPPELGRLHNMEELHLYSNKLEGPIPEELGECKELELCVLYLNYLTGSIPASFGKLSKLQNLDVHNNSMSGPIPVELFNCTQLTGLYLAYNMFSGPIPSAIGNTTALVSLRMSYNNFSGPVPEEIGNLKNLTELVLNSNSLTGSLPSGISRITTLTDIFLFDNYMSGPLPADLGMFSNLTSLVLRNNSFSGTLPTELCKGGTLSYMDISLNRFEGPLPSSLASCPTLSRFRASDNMLTKIPEGFGIHSLLEYVDISRNHLEGPLPKGLCSFSNVSSLDLSENALTGDLSSLVFTELMNLESLDLSMNNFTGEIPATIGSCVKLFRLDLSFNSLKGAIPTSLANISRLRNLYLQGNVLTGEMNPSMYASFKNLEELELGQNPWNGPVSAEIGGVSTLKNLNLSYGGYTGSIPSELGKLDQLEFLDLSHNALTGEVPGELGDLVSLVWVNISYNNLTGLLPSSWVKLLSSNPSAFVGNPGLCLHYTTGQNQCVSSGLITPTSAPPEGKKLTVGVILGIILGSTLAFFFLLVCLFWWCCGQAGRKGVEPAPVESSVELMSSPGFVVTFEEIMAVTRNLSDRFIIGRGGHGVVYKATLTSGTPIVVKKIQSLDENPTIHKSFWREIETIGNAKHRNLVKLLGFCKWGEVGLLLYDYVPNGDLHAALHNKEVGLVLNWKVRLRIAEGVAHGLAYLHHDYSPQIVHRDIKASNVLLNDDLEPRISDFGIAKVMEMQPQDASMTSTFVVSGTCGYIAPEAGYGAKATPKLDVYAYGVLLLELLTGKQPVDPTFGDTEHVVEWVRTRVQQNGGRMSEFVLDPYLLRSMNLADKDEMLRVQEIALLCTMANPADRPTMKAVVEMLIKLALASEHVCDSSDAER